MTWNYRIIRCKQKGKLFGKYIYKIHEVYYRKNGRIETWTENNCKIIGESKIDLILGLKVVLEDCKKYPVLDGNILERELKKKNPNYEKAEIREKNI